MTGRFNRFVVQISGGMVLFFNRRTELADGWWWGSDADPLQHGPFASRKLALADALPGCDGFKVVTWNSASLSQDDGELAPTGHIVVIDTAGRLFVRSGEIPTRSGWSPVH